MTDFIDRLERLGRLRAEGHVTAAEFETAKAEVLAAQRTASTMPPPMAEAPMSPPRPGGGPGGWAGRGLSPANAPAPAHIAMPVRAARHPGPRLIAGIGVVAVLIVGVLAWLMLPPTTPVASPPRPPVVAQAPAAPVPPAEPILPPLASGETLTWQAATAIDPVERQVGPLRLRVTRVGAGDAVAPSIEVGYAGQTVRLTGERGAATADHRIAAFVNRAGAAPVIMLQSFTGGAHCCTRIQLAGLSGGSLRVVDLGSWDGEPAEPPLDQSGDGVADFVMQDQAFLYAFAPYAMSLSVPRILNILGGRVVDVSARPAFRPLFTAAMANAAGTCRSGEDGLVRNGACAAYVAAAARAGRLQEAWNDMLTGYDASADWQLPTGCTVRATATGCPAGAEQRYQSYPDALLAFLKRQGYIARDWQPPATNAAADRGFGEEQPDP